MIGKLEMFYARENVDWTLVLKNVDIKMQLGYVMVGLRMDVRLFIVHNVIVICWILASGEDAIIIMKKLN